MKAKLFSAALVIALAGSNGIASAEPEAPTKACDKIVLPPDWAAWGGAASGVVGTKVLQDGEPLELSLSPSTDGETYEGSYEFSAPSAGRFNFALDSAAWIDLTKDADPLKPQSFGHGPDCSGIRKIVTFDLAAGTYRIQIKKGSSPRLRLLIKAN